MPSHRYRDVYERVSVPLTDRRWPSARITEAPLWVPVDLRDGNQALAEPMDPERKRALFELMVAMGYKEIEVGYPSASQTDFDFVRLIRDANLAPEDVTIVVFTPARRDLIERTVASVEGITNDVVIHMYTATAPVWREQVLGRGRAEVAELILAGGRDILELAGDRENVRFEFSPEVFILTEPDFVLHVCDSMTTLWDATPERPVILNLPATVEVATPNVYADQIEYMHHNLARRDGVILSVHPHNDRGTGIACAELAVLAGAQRVEGCIFGNGERTGNVDIATLALNLHAQGVDPMIDFSDIDRVRRTVEYCTRMPVPERHPYVGDLVYTAFSGTHQDAIKKGFAAHRERAARAGLPESEIPWEVPYLPIDPADVGRSYDAVIRVNSQSGKGGIAYLLDTGYGVELPRRLQIDFAGHVQRLTDATGDEVTAAMLYALLITVYAPRSGRIRLSECVIGDSSVRLALEVDGRILERSADTDNPAELLAAIATGVGLPVEILSLTRQTADRIGQDMRIAYLEYRSEGIVQWAMGIGNSPTDASCRAVLAAAARVATSDMDPADRVPTA
ncbi:2-isopropylmalate synthase [Nocardia macrotermitis]|uniref:2-isopropylmalate synthase n=1 Tax=Nocardia macrotermitis TaxID=2585198 RepID=A0A7K0D5R4_9NOCA|nr:2-isopropylmalate synthase [Nocardia macrotermitis]MQY21078.1 2-isopropylmalate synthase [Nocardia macrotermitis]